MGGLHNEKADPTESLSKIPSTIRGDVSTLLLNEVHMKPLARKLFRLNSCYGRHVDSFSGAQSTALLLNSLLLSKLLTVTESWFEIPFQ